LLKRKNFIFIFLILTLSSIFTLKTSKAATYITMEDGVITIRIDAKAATTNTRYRTIGYTVTLKPSPETAKAKGLTGPAAPIGPFGTFYLSSGEKDTRYNSDGSTTTFFTFSVDKVSNALKNILSLTNLSANTTLYFHAIFQTYRVDNSGRETILTPEIYNWRDIVNNQSWGSPEVFSQYFNIPVTFKPSVQPVDLYFIIDNKTIFQRNLGNFNIGVEASWGNFVTHPLDFEGKQYNLTGFYSKNKLTGNITEERKVGDVVGNKILTPNSIIAGSATVQYGGLNIYMIYEKDNKLEEQQYDSSLYYVVNESSKKVCDLPKKKAGQKIKWATELGIYRPENVFDSDKSYILQGYYIKPKDGKTKLQGVTSLFKNTDGASDSDIKNGEAIVVKGGIDVYIVFSIDFEPPTPTPTPTPGPSPTPKPSPTPIPTPPPLIIPEGDREILTLQPPEATARIGADIRDNERFVVQQGIPTTESLYTEAQATQYLLGYDFEKVVVVKEYNVTAAKEYTLIWHNAVDPEEIIEEKIVLTMPVKVKRACAYWRINKLEYYVIDNATILNGALPGGKSVMYPDTNLYKPPSLSTFYGSESYHIIDPVKDGDVIYLSPETIMSADENMPAVSTDSFLYEVEMMIGEIKVRNDYVSFNGIVIMPDGIYEKEAPALNNLSFLAQTSEKTNRDVMYKPNQVIEATLANNTYYSSGQINYKAHSAAVNAMPTYTGVIYNINLVNVHTPVICDPTITCNNQKWVQLINPEDDYVPLVLDPDPSLSDFTVSISNYGTHNSYVGYYSRNFAWSLRKPEEVSYMAKKNYLYRNEVKFPFDVFRKNDSGNDSGNDEYIPKNTWITIGFDKPTFYLPMWVEEGNYVVQFRTIAVNAITENLIDFRTEKYANYNQNNYVATNTINVQVSGRLFGLKITDISDKRNWEDVFHYKGMTELKIDGNYESGVNKSDFNKLYAYDYTVGVNDQYGKNTGRLPKFTLPLVNGSHPIFNNIGILPKGYTVRFRLTTIGSRYGSADSILIRPRFYHVDSQGKNRQEVDIYYSQYFNDKSNHLVKIGGTLDKTNLFSFTVQDMLPKKAWQSMADLLNIKRSEYQFKKLKLFSYSRIQIFQPLMSYSNNDYLREIKNASEYSKIRNAGITDLDIIKRMQTWYGAYWLPADIYAVPKGFDLYDYAKKKSVTLKDNFWLKDGYIIVNFDIVTVDSKGNEQLSYTNLNNYLDGYCSMWNMEGAATYKKSYQGVSKGTIEFKIEPGDFLIYSLDRSVRDDYTTYIIY
jgi:hypothetical protein